MRPAERPRVVLCHMSTREEVAWLERLKDVQWDVWGETCPHYWRLTDRDYVREGPRLKVNPPLRGEKDALAILDAVSCGTIDFVSTDHAPHTPEEKANDASAPSGIPSLEWYLPLMLELVEQGPIGWARLQDLTSANAARCYGIRGRGVIAEGMAADLVLVSKGLRSSRTRPCPLSHHRPCLLPAPPRLLPPSTAFPGPNCSRRPSQ